MKTISNEEKAKEIAQSVSFFWTNEDDCEKSIIDTVSLRKAIFNAAMQAMQWKDEEHAKEKQKLIDEACKWLAVNDSYAKPTHLQVDRLKEYLTSIK